MLVVVLQNDKNTYNVVGTDEILCHLNEMTNLIGKCSKNDKKILYFIELTVMSTSVLHSTIGFNRFLMKFSNTLKDMR